MNLIVRVIRSESIGVHNIRNLPILLLSGLHNYVGALHADAAILTSLGSNHNPGDAPAITEENLSIKRRVYEDCRLNVSAVKRCVCLMEFIWGIIEGVRRAAGGRCRI